MIKLAFWGFVALDIAALLFFFVLGLAAAGSARTHPLSVALYMLMLPGIPLLVSIFVFTRASSPVWRTLAFALAAAPLVMAGAMQWYSQAQFRANSNAAGELTFFRAGPMRELVEAIRRNDATAVAELLPKVDVNDTGMEGMTPLISALRQMRLTPERQEVLKTLIKAGVDPNQSMEHEVPLEMALQLGAKAGPEPVKLLLAAGANPNQKNSSGIPIFFAGSGLGSSVAVLRVLLDHGASLKATGPKGETALIYAATIPNWPAVLELLERGADSKQGRSFNGLTFEQLVEEHVQRQKARAAYGASGSKDDGVQAVMDFLRKTN